MLPRHFTKANPRIPWKAITVWPVPRASFRQIRTTHLPDVNYRIKRREKGRVALAANPRWETNCSTPKAILGDSTIHLKARWTNLEINTWRSQTNCTIRTLGDQTIWFRIYSNCWGCCIIDYLESREDLQFVPSSAGRFRWRRIRWGMP